MSESVRLELSLVYKLRDLPVWAVVVLPMNYFSLPDTFYQN